MGDDNPILWARQAALSSQLRQAAGLIADAAELMQEYEREHNEDLFDELAQLGARVREIAGKIERGREWS